MQIVFYRLIRAKDMVEGIKEMTTKDIGGNNRKIDTEQKNMIAIKIKNNKNPNIVKIPDNNKDIVEIPDSNKDIVEIPDSNKNIVEIPDSNKNIVKILDNNSGFEEISAICNRKKDQYKETISSKNIEEMKTREGHIKNMKIKDNNKMIKRVNAQV